MMIVASESPNFLRSSWAAPLRSHLAFSDFIKLLKSLCSRFSHVLEQFIELPRSNAVSSNIVFSIWLRSQVKTFFKRFPAVTFMTRVGASLAKFSLLLKFFPSIWCLISKPASLNRFCCACKALPLQGSFWYFYRDRSPIRSSSEVFSASSWESRRIGPVFFSCLKS